jgi:hypothetical protein
MARPPTNSVVAPIGASIDAAAAGMPCLASPAANASSPMSLLKPLWTKIPPIMMRPSKSMVSRHSAATRSISG